MQQAQAGSFVKIRDRRGGHGYSEDVRLDRIEGHTFIADHVRGGVVVDLGVNQGNFARPIRERYGCVVYGAEPIQELVDQLPQLDGIVVERVAIAGRSGAVDLHLAGACDASGVLGDGPTMAVPACTLAEFFARHGLEHVDLLKVDIEGAEIEVFAETSAETLARIKQISVEFHDFLDPSLRDAVHETGVRLSRTGFERFPFSRDNGDILFVNRAALRGPLQRVQMRTTRYIWGLGRILRRSVLRGHGRSTLC